MLEVICFPVYEQSMSEFENPEKLLRYSIAAPGGDAGCTAVRCFESSLLWKKNDVLPDSFMRAGALLLPDGKAETAIE